MTIEVSIARFKERLGWTRFLRPDAKLTIYNMGPDEVTGSLFLPDIGKASDPYAHLHHILSRYDWLADWNFFIQGDPFDHEPNIVAIINRWPSPQGFLEYSPEPGLHFLGPTSTMDVERTCWTGKPMTVNDRVTLLWRELYDCDPPDPMRFHPGFHFAATRELLRTRSRAFYERLLALIQARDMGPWECERLLGSLWLHQYTNQTRI